MPDTMRAVILRTDPPRLALALAYSRISGRPATYPGAPMTCVERPAPKLPDGAWVRVRSTLGGICGSDLKTLRLDISTRAENQAKRRTGTGPKFLGHETVGTVIEVSAGCAWARPGARVVMIPHASCAAMGGEPCRFCRDGLPLLCARRDEAAALGAGGGWSDQFVRHESQLFALDPSIPDEVGVLFDPLACALHCVLRRPPTDGESALVIGAGTIGLSVVKVLRAMGRKVRTAVCARHGFQAAAALRDGAEAAFRGSLESAYEPLAEFTRTKVSGHRPANRALDGGFDVVYDTVGTASTFHHALRWARPRGAVVLEGVNLFPGMLDRTPIWHREITILGALGHGLEEWEGQRGHTFQFISDWIRAGRLDPSGLLTHQIPFDRYREGVRIAADKRASASIKVALRFGNP